MAVGRKIKPYTRRSPLKNFFNSAERQKSIRTAGDARENLAGYRTDFENLETDNLAANYQNVFAGAKNTFSGAQNTFAGAKNQFANLENTAEDLTVNTQQADFEREQFQQSQSNLLGNLSGAAGSSGVAGLAQSLANAGMNQARQSSASIGQQESANQAMSAQQAGANQMASAQGAQAAEMAKMQGAANQQQMIMQGASNQQQMQLEGASRQQDAILKGSQSQRELEYQKVQGLMSLEAGMAESSQASADANKSWAQRTFSDRRLKKDIKLLGLSPSGIKIYSFKYIDSSIGKDTYQGVMSDEIPQDAVVKHASGYDMVDYSKLDVQFIKI
tara:strand:- start:619 stop:1611 length:993 start_codon:yes stop_codon:yes gene_type:complete